MKSSLAEPNSGKFLSYLIKTLGSGYIDSIGITL